MRDKAPVQIFYEAPLLFSANHNPLKRQEKIQGEAVRWERHVKGKVGG